MHHVIRVMALPVSFPASFSVCVCVCVPDTHSHYVVTVDNRLEGRRSETANSGHTSTLSAHQFDTDDQRSGGRSVVQNRYLWLRSLLEEHQCRGKEGEHTRILKLKSNHWALRWSSVAHGGWAHLWFFMCIKTFLDLFLINVTESPDLRNKKLVENSKKYISDVTTNLPCSDWLDWGTCTACDPVSQHSIW